MRLNTLVTLAVMTVIVVIAALITADFRAPQQQKEKPLLFPSLSSALHSVASIELRSELDSITLSRFENNWVIDDFDGYPALPEKIKAAVIGVSELRIVAAKTKDEKRYHRLGVEGLAVAGSPSLYMALRDENDAILADLIVGLARSSKAPASHPGLYVRRPDSAQSYLVEGLLDVSAQKGDWFERTVLDIPMAAVRRITVRHSDGDTYTVSKSDPGQADFVFAPVPQGKKPRSTVILNKLGSLLQGLHVDAVHAKDAIPGEQEVIDVTTVTFDGLTVQSHFFQYEQGFYASFTFSQQESADESITADTQENAYKSADELNSQFSGWVFSIPEHKYNLVAKRALDLLKDD